ncbi:hypothetical protein Hanom_Chr03g00206761 [Helianthus anomalus]
MVMELSDPAPIPKEHLKIPRGAGWYENLLALPNQTFGEQVLVATGMNDRWPHTSTNVPMLLLDGAEITLYHRAFHANAGVMRVRPLRGGEELLYEQIRCNFMYPVAEFYAAPPITTEGARVPNPRPCRAITTAGEEVVLISNGESIASLEHGLKFPPDVFASSLREHGVDHEDKNRRG